MTAAAGMHETALAAAVGRELPFVRQFLAHLSVPTMVAAALLVLAAGVVALLLWGMGSS
jgi:hypothetical protein